MSGVGSVLLGSAWTTAATVLSPALRVALRHRAANGREIGVRLNERFGIDATPRPAGKLLWMHAASVGETMSILPVLQALRRHAKVLLTTGTVTSQALLAERLPALGLEADVLARFAPLDVPAWVRRFLSHWQPDAACFVESELWPTQLGACRERKIPLMLLNARMSDRSFARWRQFRGVAGRLLNCFDVIHARGEQDAARLRGLGAPPVALVGDLKLAAPPLAADVAELQRLGAMLGDRPAWLAASTHPGEEEMIAETHRIVARGVPDLLSIVAPRHPQRGEALAQMLQAPRRSAGALPPAGSGLWIADTVGEMGLWYRLAPIVLIGRSLLPPGGGQNPLEAARLRCALAVGPYMGNFAEHVALLREAGALTEVADPEALARFVIAMLADPDRRRRLGEQAAATLRGHEDLPARSADALLSLLRAG